MIPRFARDELKTDFSPQLYARMAGLLYLVIIAGGIFAVRSDHAVILRITSATGSTSSMPATLRPACQ